MNQVVGASIIAQAQEERFKWSLLRRGMLQMVHQLEPVFGSRFTLRVEITTRETEARGNGRA